MSRSTSNNIPVSKFSLDRGSQIRRQLAHFESLAAGSTAIAPSTPSQQRHSWLRERLARIGRRSSSATSATAEQQRPDTPVPELWRTTAPKLSPATPSPTVAPMDVIAEYCPPPPAPRKTRVVAGDSVVSLATPPDTPSRKKGRQQILDDGDFEAWLAIVNRRLMAAEEKEGETETQELVGMEDNDQAAEEGRSPCGVDSDMAALIEMVERCADEWAPSI
ncbi:hypothetical protein DL764_001924 [Monosporascus ibericus]|uniref:Uncharacterized protein n=1 Tax=Monosporascus ibericus TaxID=155417 RepID=A0A4Q4TMG9_9PEZI|nr:hypothetical protein DL764_001924 [Monosporascus ibericus]